MVICSIANTTFNSVCQGIKKSQTAVKQAVLNIIPERVISGNKSIKATEFIGDNISSAENRLILGVTALMSQPFIDGHNKSVDENTRKISVARTIAKIIAGTVTGYTIRKLAIVGVKELSKVPGAVDKAGKLIKTNRLNTILTPKNAIPSAEELTVTVLKKFKLKYSQYQKALGTIIALIVMVFTNFLIDAPLTKFLTNRIAKRSGGDK